MSNKRSKRIKAVTGLSKTVPTDIVSRSGAVLNGISADPADYPAPPVDMPTYKSNIDLLSSDIIAALDGGKKAIAQRNHQADVVIQMYKQLAN